MSWKDCDCGMARIRAEIERCSTCEIAAHKDEQIAALTRELDEARAEVRRDGMSDSDFALRLASPAELREMVQTLTRERDEAAERLQHIQEQLDQMAAMTIREMEGWTADALRTAIAFERVTSAELREVVQTLTRELDEARAEVKRLRAALTKAKGETE